MVSPPSPRPSTPHSPQHSATRSVPPPSSPLQDKEVVAKKEVVDFADTKPLPELVDPFEYMDSAEYTEKYKKYEAEYTLWLNARYFSNKNLYGGNIYDHVVQVGNETIKSSRWPNTRTYADPVQAFKDLSNDSASPEDASSDILNGKSPSKKSG
ncbi:hypothetical protein RJ641_009502 [Dillenia turbinata]|uniref:Uncharacterized protein n=1 Tax=Dillenia turbinata TaxID=194707 RepID=A0AAN8V7Z7_9MAGN